MKTALKASVYFLSVVLLAASSGCNVDCIKGSGNQTTQMRTVSEFSEIEVGGAVKLVLKQDSVQSVKIIADDNIQKEIKVRVSGDKLEFSMDGNYCDEGPITIYISAKTFNGLKASGAVEVLSDGRINTKDFELKLSGASKISLDLSAAKISTHSSGASEINLKGQAGEHQVDLSGASKVNALDFVVGDYEIESSGASKCRINVLNALEVRSSGASEVEYRGNPTKVRNHDSGASSVKKIN